MSATNARGNIFDDEYSVTWTGPVIWCNMKQDVLWRIIHCVIIGVTVLITQLLQY